MTEYRPLTEAERQRYEKVFKDESEKCKILSWDIESTEALLDHGLEAQFLAIRRKHEHALKGMKSDFAECSFVAKDAEDKLKQGVEIKETTEEFPLAEPEDDSEVQ